MSETKFTHGPWSAKWNGVCWQIDAASDAVATTQFCYAPEAASNAHVIAAAPDLYTALSELVCEADFDAHPEDFAPVWHRARAALRKAIGSP